MKKYTFLMIGWVAIASARFHFNSVHEETAFWHLLERYRCVVCQNQSIADSDAKIAEAMREFVYSRWQEGDDIKEIDVALASRYGDFVLEKPPMHQYTWLLWFLPILISSLAIFIWFRQQEVVQYSVDEGD